MTTDEAKQVYELLFTAFPSTRDWLAATSDPQATYGVWCGVLAGVDVSDAKAVANAMIRGDEAIPEAYERERFPQMLRAAASRIRSDRRDRERMNGLHVAANEARTVDERFMVAMREARRLGERVKAGKLSRNDNLAMVEELVDWAERSGPLPEWIE